MGHVRWTKMGLQDLLQNQTATTSLAMCGRMFVDASAILTVTFSKTLVYPPSALTLPTKPCLQTHRPGNKITVYCSLSQLSFSALSPLTLSLSHQEAVCQATSRQLSSRVVPSCLCLLSCCLSALVVIECFSSLCV